MTKNFAGFKRVSINITDSTNNCFKTLVKDILKGQEMLIEPGLSIFVVPDGTIFEFYDTGSHFPEYLFSHGKVVNGYQVPDIYSALDKLQKQGAILLGRVEHLNASCFYCHIRLEDDSIIGLFQITDEMV